LILGGFVAVRVNDRVKLDPAFGDTAPKECDAFWVMVTPKSKSKVHLMDYFFVLLLPAIGDEQGMKELITDCMREALNPGDEFTTKSIKHEDLDQYDPATPILSYDPIRLEATGDVDLIWLLPPRALMQ
jgi:hypothetical protein